MKTKLLLMLLALTGVCWSVDRADAYTTKSTASTAHLSQTMGELIGFDRDTYSLLAVAIDRALIAQANGVPQPTTAGVPIPPNASPPKKQPEMMGKVAVPSKPDIGQPKTKKAKTRPQVKPSATKNSSKIIVGLF
ncbi:hypothetical protein [Chamaesiphon sp. VAR_69_metabat_338]|uniref:hypothetical protein n=1 Tax=Chamaesiphon sp. VAR_69_metabat_338 TaxID=2964704 RepID=UPI00286D9577|nr:hypothetical protein [Chamaesiphon sp. VAR_69_metabat_338]